MRYRVELRPEVQGDIDNAYVFYEGRHEGLGEHFLASLQIIFSTLEIHPQSFGYKFGLRSATVKLFPYIVLFKI